MDRETRALIARLEILGDMGCRPSVAMTLEIIATIQHQDAVIADLERRIAELRLQLTYHEREAQRID